MVLVPKMTTLVSGKREKWLNRAYVNNELFLPLKQLEFERKQIMLQAARKHFLIFSSPINWNFRVSAAPVETLAISDVY